MNPKQTKIVSKGRETAEEVGLCVRGASCSCRGEVSGESLAEVKNKWFEPFGA